MKVEVKELDQLKREISVEIPPETVNKKIEIELKDLQKKAKIKGFRPGKTPMKIIESNFGEEVKADVFDKLIKETYPNIIKEQALDVASHPTVTNIDMSEEGVFTYTAQVEVYPKIDDVTIENLEYPKEETEATDEEVDEYIEMVRKQHSTLNKVERKIEDKDTVVIDLVKLEDPKNILKEDKFPASVIDLSNKFTLKEFREELIGMSIGEEKDININYADDYPDEKFAGAEIKYNCKIREINQRVLPELNDAFAKTSKLAETALELKLNVRKEIKAHKEEQLKKQQKNTIISQLVAKNEIPVPQAVLNNYLDNIVEDFKKQGQEFNEEDVRKQYRAVGEMTFRWNLMYHFLAKKEKIEVLPVDTENLISKFAENYKMTIEQTKEALQQSGKIADIRESILEEKVLDYLFSNAKVVKAEKK